MILNGLFQRFDVEFNRLNHVFGSHNLVKVFLAQDAFFKHKIIDALARFESLLGYFSRMFVTDDRIEGSYQ